MAIDIYQYIEYRSPMRLAYEARKAQGRYSFAQMSQDLGFKDRSFVQHILNGVKELPQSALDSTLSWLGLSTDAEREYFLLLWEFSQTKNPVNKEFLWQKIRRLCQAHREPQDLASQRLEIFDQWWSFPIKELLCLGIVEPREIQKSLRTQIPLEAIHETVQKLIALDFVKLGEDGVFEDLSPVISAPTQAEYAEAVRNYQSELIELSRQALVHTSPKERETLTLGMPLSPEGIAEVRQLIKTLQSQILEVLDRDQQSGARPSQYTQVVLSAFPLADIPTTKNDGKMES